jgi:hypothetical protein
LTLSGTAKDLELYGWTWWCLLVIPATKEAERED